MVHGAEHRCTAASLRPASPTQDTQLETPEILTPAEKEEEEWAEEQDKRERRQPLPGRGLCGAGLTPTYLTLPR